MIAARILKEEKFANMFVFVTGDTAKSIQSINVAAVAAAAAAAFVAGLASPAATHRMKKQRVWSKTALFSLFFSFLEQPYLFSHVHARPELVRQQGETQ